MVDSGSEKLRLHPAWHALGRCLAVASAAIVALVSLLRHVPAWVACLRGGLTWLCVLVVVRLGLAAFERAVAADSERAARATEAGRQG